MSHFSLRFLALSGLLLIFGCAAPQEGHPSLSRSTRATGWRATCDLTTAEAATLVSGAAARPAAAVAAVNRGGKTYVGVHIEFSDADSCSSFSVPDVHVFNRFQKWADAYARATDATLDAIDQSPGYLWKEFGKWIFTPPPKPGKPSAARGETEEIVRGGIGKMTGRGVIVAVVDSGIDFRHPDFITRDASGRPESRILYLWDTFSDDFDARGVGQQAPVTYPGGSSVGTVYTRSQLTAELRSTTGKLGPKDLCGHGTACAGIAAGNGSADERSLGVAPDADLIVVRIGSTPDLSLQNGYLLGAACAWIDRVAGSAPCVISCSYGGHGGGHDGAKPLERQLDARFANDVKGRALCISAGNEATHGLHGETPYGGAARKGTLRWRTAPSEGASVSVYYSTPGNENVSVEVTGTKGNQAKFVWKTHPITEQWVLTIESPPGEYTCTLWSESGSAGRADAYISASESSPRFIGPSAKAGFQIGSPGTAGQAITVGSYDFNSNVRTAGQNVSLGEADSDHDLTVGAISNYSNPGPRRRDSAVKPEITAPGQYHVAAAPLDPCFLDQLCKRDPTGKYVADFCGTSASTPYCAGIVALMLQKNPQLTVGKIRDLLREGAAGDERTGPRPCPLWGHGKLTLPAALKIIDNVPAP